MRKVIGTIFFLTVAITTFWYSKAKTYHIPIPLEFNESNIPVAKITIEKSTYLFELDLGSKLQLTMEPDSLKPLSKTRYGSGTWFDILGKQYEYPRYKLTEVEIGSLHVKPVFVIEKPRNINSILWNSSKKKKISSIGHIGRPLLSRFNLLLDFKRNLMFFSNSFSKLRKNGYDLKNFLKVPFEISSNGIFFNVQLDSQNLKLLLDTGSTLTILNEKHMKSLPLRIEKNFPTQTIEKFKISGHDFGPKKVYYLNFPFPFQEIDGALGMDFLKNEVIYLDFKKNLAYIKINPILYH